MTDSPETPEVTTAEGTPELGEASKRDLKTIQDAWPKLEPEHRQDLVTRTGNHLKEKSLIAKALRSGVFWAGITIGGVLGVGGNHFLGGLSEEQQTILNDAQGQIDAARRAQARAERNAADRIRTVEREAAAQIAQARQAAQTDTATLQAEARQAKEAYERATQDASRPARSWKNTPMVRRTAGGELEILSPLDFLSAGSRDEVTFALVTAQNAPLTETFNYVWLAQADERLNNGRSFIANTSVIPRLRDHMRTVGLALSRDADSLPEGTLVTYRAENRPNSVIFIRDIDGDNIRTPVSEGSAATKRGDMEAAYTLEIN